MDFKKKINIDFFGFYLKNTLCCKLKTIALLLLLTNNVYAQNSIFSGVVLDANTKATIANAELTDNQFNLLALTNRKGEFSFKTDNKDPFELIIFKEGFAYFRKIISVENRMDIEKILLEPLSGDVDEVTIKSERENEFGIGRMNTIEGFGIYAGKKSEIISMRDIPANLATNNSRQVFAKVPGFNIWESDCAGLQLGVGGRGLSPNRSTNFNMRQNGYDISADPMGYPESYYAPPMQAIEKIEVVRGASSLQYGSQFGGLVNFKLKKGNEDKKIELNSSQTVGSYWYTNSFNSIGGQVGKLNYYTYYQYRRGNCWRCNSKFGMHAAFARLEYDFSEKITISAETTFLTYLAQQAGGLTDLNFELDPQQSMRDNNWFQINWSLSSANLNWQISKRAKLNTKFTYLNGARNAVGNLDRIDRVNLEETERTLLVDNFKYLVNETKFLYRYNFLGSLSNLLVGSRLYTGNLQQRQGLSATENAADFTFLNPEPYYLSYRYPSENAALFAENVFQINPKWNITPGVRFEFLSSKSQGSYFNYLSDLAGNIYATQEIEEDKTNNRTVSLFGITSSYKPNTLIEIYGGISQNYRPIGFSDLRVSNANLVIDTLITDEKGFNIDFGTRGDIWKGALNFDFTVFYLKYGNKIGNKLITIPDTILFDPVITIERSARFRTNVAAANIIGLEGFAELDYIKKFYPNIENHRFSHFINLAIISGRYKSEQLSIDNKFVEYIPPVNLKTGFTYSYKNKLKIGGQFTFVSQHYSEATNATFSPSAVEGIIPTYNVIDLFTAYTIKKVKFELSVNNLTNQKYFTRRATGYPGPGIIPAEGLSVFLTTNIQL